MSEGLITRTKPEASTATPYMKYLVLGSCGAALFVYVYAITHKKVAHAKETPPTVTIGYTKPPPMPVATPLPEPAPQTPPPPLITPTHVPPAPKQPEKSELQKAREKERMEAFRAPIRQAAF